MIEANWNYLNIRYLTGACKTLITSLNLGKSMVEQEKSRLGTSITNVFSNTDPDEFILG